MAEKIKPIRLLDGTVTNLVDKKTKQSVNYKPVTTYYDGSAMTNAKVDGDLYIKNSGVFYRKVIDKDGELFLEKDTMAQMRALTSFEILLLKAGVYKGVKLNGYYVSGDTPIPIEYLLSNTNSLDNGGNVVLVGDIKLEHFFNGDVNIKYFGAKGDDLFDETNSFINAVKYVCDRGGVLFIPSGNYRIYDTIEIKDSLSFQIIGESTQKTNIFLYSEEEDKSLFFLAPSSTYTAIKRVGLFDRSSSRRKLIGVKAQDELINNDFRSNWKLLFEEIRWHEFKVGYLATTANPLDGATQSFLDSATFFHSKFRNCLTAYKNQNIQAVNINFFNVDIENDNANELNTMIRDEAGFNININGGSWIGRGRIYEGVYPTGGVSLFSFAKINFYGTKFELRPTTMDDLVSTPKSTNGFTCEVSFSDCGFTLYGGETSFVNWAGKSVIRMDNCNVLNGALRIKQFPTTNISGASVSGGLSSFGKIEVNNCKGVVYNKETSSPYGTYNASYTAPVNIINKTSNPNGNLTADAQSFLSSPFSDIRQRGVGLGNITPSMLVYNNDNVSTGLFNLKIKIPYYGTPTHLTLFKQPVRHFQGVEYKLYVVKDNADWVDPLSFNVTTDAILIAQTGSTTGKSGYMEFPINLNNGYFQSSFYFQSGFGRWLEGRMYLEHSGTLEPLAGFVGVKYI